MAKKKQFTPDNGAPEKSVNEMSDLEFITYADYLSSPYYRAYINAQYAKNDVVSAGQGNGKMSQRAVSVADHDRYNRAPRHVERPIPVNVNSSRATAVSNSKKYTKKRGLFLVLIAVLMLVVLAAGIVGLLSISTINPYVSIFSRTADGKNISIGLIDPVLGLGKKLVNLDVESNYYTMMKSALDGSDIAAKIFAYALPIAALIIVICAIIGFVKAIGALCRGKDRDGYFRKFKFGFLSIVMLLCAAVVALGGIFVAGIPLKNAMLFVTMKSKILNAGYALFAIVGIPILTFVCSLVSYKKLKV